MLSYIPNWRSLSSNLVILLLIQEPVLFLSGVSALEQRQAATGTLFGRPRGKRRGLALRKWAKVSLRGGAQVASHEPRLSFCSAPLRFALFGLSHCTETLGLPWQGKNLDRFLLFFSNIYFFIYFFQFLLNSLSEVTYGYLSWSKKVMLIGDNGRITHSCMQYILYIYKSEYFAFRLSVS